MPAPLDILKKYWDFNQFRPLQEDIIASVLAGHDTLALLPTGGGKSICFQVPALCQEGICLVISPLIALMKDQVMNLKKRNIPAAAIYSGMPYREIDITFDNAVHGGLKFLYLSPERLETELAIERIRRMNVNLLAVDEAHCISQWGYDFRPPYLRVAEIRTMLPKTPVLALTATATKEVVEDIQLRLGFRRGKVFQKSFARSNLSYVVLHEMDKQRKLVEIVKKVQGTGIVYVRNRRETQDLATLLQREGIQADYYHAGVPGEERSKKQEAWTSSRTRVVVSTNAFGMGIDKPDVRFVVHMDLPDSIEAYFQEAGRGGRDEKKSYAVLLFHENDGRLLQYKLQNAYPPLAEIKQVYRALGSYFQLAVGAGQGVSFDFDIVEFARNFKLDPVRSHNALKVLEQEGWIALTEAVWTPATFQFTVGKEALYNFQVRNSRMERVVKGLLRLHERPLEHSCQIKEEAVARHLKMSTEDLVKALQNFQAEGILTYSPQKEKPQMTFLRERVDAADLTIDISLYNFRRTRAAERVRRAIAYAENNLCRSQQLLSYFGETESKPCGVCDVCLERNKTQLSPDEYERLKEKVRLLLEKEQLTIEQLVQSFAPKRQNQVVKAIEFLADEGFVQNESGKFFWKKGG